MCGGGETRPLHSTQGYKLYKRGYRESQGKAVEGRWKDSQGPDATIALQLVRLTLVGLNKLFC